ncbi:flagellar biosynthetic protein FliO [Halothiobacillus sp. 15-55-196]|uniref:flagellar biosynthetic protein FliO n=1 Tax=Halothiobacillus sp. 15-55-196 TaxID=1970382 RepID=UPI0025C18A87|nr:flagellar biosynthetic protein FliO [Halothiobacillus sp. 15-55-196]
MSRKFAFRLQRAVLMRGDSFAGWLRRYFHAKRRLPLHLIFLALAFMIGNPFAALAAEVAPATPAVNHAAESVASPISPKPGLFDPLSSGYLLKLVFSLVIVLALMFVVVWLLKRTGRFNGRTGSYPLNVLAQMPVGARERVLLIAVGERQMLLGVSQGHIEPLGWVDPPLSPDVISKSNPLEGAFAQLMKNHMPQSPSAGGTVDTSGVKRESSQ